MGADPDRFRKPRSSTNFQISVKLIFPESIGIETRTHGNSDSLAAGVPPAHITVVARVSRARPGTRSRHGCHYRDSRFKALRTLRLNLAKSLGGSASPTAMPN